MPRGRSASPLHCGATLEHKSGSGNGGLGLVIHQVVQENGGSRKYLVLTKTNYYSWAGMMQLKLQVRGLWEVVTMGTYNYTDDRNALEVIALGVPPKM